MNFSRMTCEARPGRIGPLATLPVFLVLDGKRAVIAGGRCGGGLEGGTPLGRRCARRRLRRGDLD